MSCIKTFDINCAVHNEDNLPGGSGPPALILPNCTVIKALKPYFFYSSVRYLSRELAGAIFEGRQLLPVPAKLQVEKLWEEF